MDVPGILIGKREEKCTADREHERHSNDLTEPMSLSPESEEVVSKLSTKSSRCLSGGTATGDSDAATSTHSKRGGKSSGKEKGSTPRKPTPNAFVSLRVSSPSIHKGLQAVQEKMVGKDEAVRSTLTSLDKLHITLSVIRLENDDDQERAKLALFAATQKVMSDLDLCKQPLILTISGLSSFGQRVVFADIVEKERLEKMAGIVRLVFEDHGFPDVGGQSSFNPHLTIAKMSRVHTQGGRGRRHGRRRGRGLVGLHEELYQEFKDTDFGTEKVTGIELLSMVHPPDRDGYYHCFQQYSFKEEEASCIPNSED